MKEPNVDQEAEVVLAGTSWMQGFLEGRENGFSVGLRLGLMTAIKELERLIENNNGKNQQEIDLALKAKELEQRLSELGFIRK